MELLRELDHLSYSDDNFYKYLEKAETLRNDLLVIRLAIPDDQFYKFVIDPLFYHNPTYAGAAQSIRSSMSTIEKMKLCNPSIEVSFDL